MSRRSEKVEALIQRSAAEAVVAQFSSNNTAVTITKVDVSPDLKNARVFAGIVGRQREEVSQRLSKVGPSLIAQQLARDSALRSVPRISIVIDDSAEYAQHISQLLQTTKDD